MRRTATLALALCAFLALPRPSALAQAQDPALTVSTTRAQPTARKQVVAARRASEVAIEIDGRPEEAIWQNVTPVSGFTQRDPDEGKPASQRTEVRILYDDDALYLAAHLYDTAPDSLVTRLGRRDDYNNADVFHVFVDPYLDRRSGFYFGLSAAGTIYDGVMMNDSWDDDSWDGVWQGATALTDDGWTLEMRIPLSQLRFKMQESGTYTWGINFRRDVARHNEADFFVMVPRQESGFVSHFADLTGIADIRPRRQIELLPFVTARARFDEAEAGNPFQDGSAYTPNIGGDLKIGLTSNLTLDATVNPDFGQVEVDPAVVNLSDNEVFFPERRPFFVEGANTFNFGYGGSNSGWGFNWGNPDLFYSRRIGSAPGGPTPNASYIDYPDATTILGAAKLTGRIGDGWQVGTVQAVTGAATADLALADGTRTDAVVEPYTYYGVARGLREFDQGARALGFMATATNRFFPSGDDGDRLESAFNGNSFVGGLDGWTMLDKDQTWVVTGWGAISHVTGTEGRIEDLQRSSLHYFQRPDQDHVSVDPEATSLTGWAGRVMLNKQRGAFTINTALGAISPGFDSNDLGFLFRTDVVNGHFVATQRFNEGYGPFRRTQHSASFFQSFTFDGTSMTTGLWTGHSLQFHNFWSIWSNAAYIFPNLNARATRGGPLMHNPAGLEFGFELDSDSRKTLVGEIGANGFVSEGGSNVGFYVEGAWQPLPTVNITIQPRLSLRDSPAQYVTTVDDVTATETFGARYVFAQLDQTTLSASIRANWTFTPRLSFQLYAQPFVSSGRYSDYKFLDAPRTFDFTTFGEGGSTFTELSENAENDFRLDPDGDGAAESFDIDDRDFTFASLRGTAVLRWEYRSGSTLFLVWTQDRSDRQDLGDFRVSDSLDDLFNVTPTNIFMVKLTYWLGR